MGRVLSVVVLKPIAIYIPAPCIVGACGVIKEVNLYIDAGFVVTGIEVSLGWYTYRDALLFHWAVQVGRLIQIGVLVIGCPDEAH